MSAPRFFTEDLSRGRESESVRALVLELRALRGMKYPTTASMFIEGSFAKSWISFCEMFATSEICMTDIENWNAPLLWEGDIAKLNDNWGYLQRRKYYLANQEALDLELDAAFAKIHSLIQPALSAICPERTPVGTPTALFETELVNLLPDPREVVGRLYDLFIGPQFGSSALFQFKREDLLTNAAEVSGVPSAERYVDKLIPPSKSTLPLLELVEKYLANTRLELLLLQKVPIKWTFEQRYNHTHMLGSSGAGKSTFIELAVQRDLLHDLLTDDRIAKPENPSVVLIDPHSDLVRSIARGGWGNKRVILIDPADEYPPAVNLFAVNQVRMASYDSHNRERVRAGVMQTLDYFFQGVLKVEFTPKQTVLFHHLVRLLLTFPEVLGRNATLYDMLDITTDPAPFAHIIAALPEHEREFFERDFVSTDRSMYKTTREELRYRIDLALDNPAIRRFLTTPENKIDLFEELNRGSVILVDCGKDLLLDDAPTFGRIWLSLVFRALLERTVLPPSERHPTFLYVDEAGAFLDQNVDNLLTDVRKFKCGCFFSHQQMSHASERLRSALSANTATKFCSTSSAGDAAIMARDMRTSPDFILQLPKFHFATYIRGVTPHAIPVEINRDDILTTKQNDAAWDEFLALNRYRTSNGKRAADQRERVRSSSSKRVGEHAPDGGNDEISQKW